MLRKALLALALIASAAASALAGVSGGGVTEIIAGTNVTISPTNGLGQVTINSSGPGVGETNTYGQDGSSKTITQPLLASATGGIALNVTGAGGESIKYGLSFATASGTGITLTSATIRQITGFGGNGWISVSSATFAKMIEIDSGTYYNVAQATITATNLSISSPGANGSTLQVTNGAVYINQGTNNNSGVTIDAQGVGIAGNPSSASAELNINGFTKTYAARFGNTFINNHGFIHSAGGQLDFGNSAGQQAFFQSNPSKTADPAMGFISQSAPSVNNAYSFLDPTGAFSLLDISTRGWVGISTGSPTAQFEVHSTTSPTSYIVKVSSKDNTPILSVMGNGNFDLQSSSAAWLSGCGTTPTIVAGSDNTRGAFTTGTAGTSCTLNFSMGGFSATPFCIVQDKTSGLTSPGWTESTTTLAVTALTAGDKYSYICFGH